MTTRYVVTFGRSDDVRGLRRMSLCQALRLRAYAVRAGMPNGRILAVTTTTTEGSEQ